MSEEQKSVHESKKQKSRKELLDPALDLDSLTTDELARRNLFIESDQKNIQLEVLRRQNAQFQMKDAENKDKFISRGRELRNARASQKKQQDQCSHRKGGRGLEALYKGGTDASDYALIRHLLPWNEWYVRCQRCGKTWAPPRPEHFDLTTSEGKADFEKAKADYKWASIDAPSNNSFSTGITFKHASEDDDKSAKQFVRDVTKDITLR